jgi:branched-chain amino acid aminotransferase
MSPSEKRVSSAFGSQERSLQAMRIVILNGQITPPEAAAISVYDRGFLYGDSVFETIRTYGGKPFALGEHLARLQRSADRVFITLPAPLATLEAEVLHGLSVSDNAESFVRIMLTRGTGPLGLDPDLAEKPNRVVLVEPFVPPAPECYAKGVDAIVVHAARATDATPAAGAKVANYLTSLLAIREARRKGAVEALIVDARGSVLEGTTSNVFLVKGGELVTPPDEVGILAGITRAHVLRAASHIGVKTVLRDVREPELFAADELFISSTLREILPVVRLDGRTIANGVPGEVTKRLHEAFRKDVAGAA